jgi:MFS family permease
VRRVGRLGPLRERPFRLLWFARTGSSVGDSLIPVALSFAVINHVSEGGIGGGPVGLGIVLACWTVGRASVTLAGGVWADRLPRRLVMISADLVRLGTQTTTAALLLGGVAHIWELAVLQTVAGAAGGFFGPASTALLPQAVSEGMLQKANSLLTLSRSGTQIFGPAVAGGLVVTVGPGWCFAIDAASFLFSAVFVSLMRVAPHEPPVAQRFWRDLADGWVEVRRHRWLTAGFLGFALGNVGIGIYLVLGPLVAKDELAFHQLAWGLVLTSGSVGGVLGGLVAYRIRPAHPVATAFAIWTLGACLPLALVPPLALGFVMVAAAIVFASILIGNVLWETAMQQEVRPDRLARVASIDLLLSLCLMPLGSLLAGPLSTALGVRSTLLLAAVLMSVPNFLVLVFVREVRSVRRRDADNSPALAA